MSKTETKFRAWARKECPGACIKKIPDFKQAGTAAVIGLPDYVIFWSGTTTWVEVKSVTGYTLNVKNHFTPAQKVVFTQMMNNDVDVLICWFDKDLKMNWIRWSWLLFNEGKVTNR